MIATAAHADAAPNKWWPQAWPAPVSLSIISLKGEVDCANPGSASNSPRMPITGPDTPYSAINAVGMPATPLVILKPSFSSSYASKFELLNSW